MRTRVVAVAAAVALGALIAPASAQIIATSIPKEGGAAAKGGAKFGLHLMGSPFAKWKINSYNEEPKGSDDPTFISASTTDSKSKFILAGEMAFAAGDNVSIGVGGWYNDLGEADVDFLELDAVVGAFGTATADVSVWEGHGNVFYKDVGIQVGVVKTTRTITGFRQGSTLLNLVTGEGIVFTRDVTLQEAGVPEEDVSTTNWDAFAVYRKGSSSDSKTTWSVSLGAGMYRDNEAKATTFSGFVTGAVGIYKGLGIDASLWYVGGKKQSTTRQALAEALETSIDDNLTRLTVGIGYSFSN